MSDWSLRFALAIATVLAWTLGASAQGPKSQRSGKSHAKVELVCSVSEVAVGQPFEVGLKFKIEKGWHIYWKNGGDAGLPPRVSWTLPDGFTAGDLKFPVPRRYVDAGGLTSYIHDGEPMLVAEISVPKALGDREITVAAKGKYLICRDLCIWEHFDLQRRLAVSDSGARPTAANRELFAAAHRTMPRTTSKHVTVTPTVSKKSLLPNTTFDLLLTLKIAEGYSIPSHDPGNRTIVGCDLFVERTPGVYFDPAVYPKSRSRNLGSFGQVNEYAGSVAIRVPGETDEELPAEPPRLGGVLVFQACDTSGQCLPKEAVEWSFLAAVRKASAAVADETLANAESGASERDNGAAQPESASVGGPLSGLPGWLQVAVLLLGCFGYGLFINATPCVLPLLSIKVLGFVQQAHESRRRTLMLGLAFGAGVMVFFVVLGFLASAGTNVLQYPAAVIGLGAVVMALALSMLGVYTLEAPSAATTLESNIRQEGMLASFGKGALAPVLGFACTGPLLAGVFGWATKQPPTLAVVAFLSTGLGMASPYILLGANPNWLSFLPKPGAWMITFERVMGFLLLGMVVWLIHPVVAHMGASGLELTLVFFVTIGFACWILGQVDATMPAVVRWRYRGGAGSIVLVSGLVIYGWAYGEPASAVEWRTWSSEAVARTVSDGNAAFVDFTAAWCTVCKANKKLAINTPEVLAELKARGIVAFQGDFTARDEAIFNMLQKYNRAGVPLNLIYPAGRPDDPIVLRTNLTKQYLLDKLGEAVPRKTASMADFGP